jgi:hypothetical protein
MNLLRGSRLNSDMGGDCALSSNSSVVGRLHDARASQLDIFGTPRDHAASDQYLHGRRACFAGYQRGEISRPSGALFRSPKDYQAFSGASDWRRDAESHAQSE